MEHSEPNNFSNPDIITSYLNSEKTAFQEVFKKMIIFQVYLIFYWWKNSNMWYDLIENEELILSS